MSIKLDYRNNLRGIRKCPRCGTFNGNRASNCKNRSCLHKLRDDTHPGRKASQAACAVQLLPTYAHLYSVCLRSGVRNFIVASVGADGTIAGVSIASESTSTGVESDASSLIKQLIVDCKNTANALPLHRSIVDSLVISEAEQRSLWEKQSQCNAGPLVQRLGNDLFAVGHAQSAYGLCHVDALKKNLKCSQFQCDCLSADERKASPVICWHILAVVAGLLSSSEKTDERWKPLLQQFLGHATTAGVCLESGELELIDASVPSEGQLSNEPLLVAGQSIEMIDCILNPTMMELFCDDADNQPGLVSLDALMDMPSEGPIFELAIGDTRVDPPVVEPCSHQPVITTNAESLHLMDCQIELMDEFDLTDRIDFCPSDIECDESMLLPASVIENLSTEVIPKEGKKEKLVEVTAKKSALRQCGRVEKEKLTRGSYSVRKLMKVLESNGVIFNRLQRSRNGVADPAPGQTSGGPGYEATLCSLSFTRWLEAVIEQLNAIIDYNTDGKPAPQTFRIHEDFFRCLRARFSVGHRLRQPEETHTAEPAECPAEDGQRTHLFRFSHHKSLLHVFRTDRIQLAFEKSFIRASEDNFIAIDPPEDSQEGSDAKEIPPIGARPIRAHRYSTYIKIGRYKHEADPNRVYNFTVEWTGGVLPRSGFGDLRISFEYGHRTNNQYVPPPGEAVGEEI